MGADVSPSDAPLRRPGRGLEAQASSGLDDARWALSYVAPYWRTLAFIVGLSMLSTGLSLVLPYLSKLLVDEALLAGDAVALLQITGLFMAVTLANFGANVLSGLRYARASAEILFDMRLDVYRHLQRLSPRFWARTPLGEVVSRINNDVGEIQRVAADTALGWLGNVLFLLGTVGMLIWLDLRLFVVSVLLFPAAVWALVRYRRVLEERVAVMRDRSAGIGSFLIETLRAVRLTVAHNAQEREAGRFRARNDGFIRALMGMQRARYLAGGLPGLILSASTAIVFLYGGWRVITGAITLGTFVAFMAYQMRLLSPVQGLMGLYTGVATARVSLGRVRQLLDVEPEVREPAEPAPAVAPRGAVVLEDVRFDFGRDGPVLDGVDLRVAPGEVVAIVGASGSGKSTIVDLLVRHLDPDSGRILLDGRDLRTLRLADLRSRVVALEQEPFLFHATVAENIRYARPDAGDEEVHRAARAAGLDEFVRALPRGLETVVGEGGAEVSAGERQRIALARALLADPAVLVLDEATANLDPATEARVVRGYEAAMHGRTTILVSHRLELARRADRVVVLEAGRIAEDGAPEALLRRGGRFARLFAGGPARSAAVSGGTVR